jgi:RNA polymerase sigma-70 factor, ECF subfamily
VPEDPDSELVSRLRVGDEGAFAELAGKYQGAMMSMARGYVPSGAVAEEVVQDAWVGVLSGYRPVRAPFIVRTWLFRILVNRAISAGVRERRERPRGRYGARRHASRFDASGGWQVPPEPWADQVDDKVIAAKIADRILTAIDELPLQQKEVVTLRDVQGLSSEEVCAILDISNVNQRVLLHRGRSKLRQVIGSEFGSIR